MTNGAEDLYQRAVELVVTAQFGSVSMVQRRLGCRFAEAKALLARMEQRGIVAPTEGSRAHDVLIASLADLPEGGPGMTIEVTRQLRIAVAAEYRKLAAKVEAGEKDAFLRDNPVGTRQMVVDDEGTVLGAVSIAKPSKGSPRYEITDEGLAMAWALHEFGEGVLETITRLTPQGRLSVIEAAKAMNAKGDGLPPGVELFPPSPSKPSVSWTSEKSVDAAGLIVAMAARGVLSLGEILALEAGE